MKEFNNEECTESTNEISHKVCEFIKTLDTEDKYIVNTTLFEKGNLGITMSGTCIWDTLKDGFLNINEENDNLIIVISIWGLSTDWSDNLSKYFIFCAESRSLILKQII